MDEDELFKILKRQTKATLLELLYSAYHQTNAQQKRYIFGDLVKASQPEKASAKDILKKTEDFYQDSLAGVYYAPFDINSKNFSHIPEETEEWFDKLGDLLEASTKLTKQKEHPAAVASFKILFELIAKMEDGEEIIFADEYGSWMIPGDEKEWLNAYLSSLAKVEVSPEEYVNIVVPLIKRDSYSSFCSKVYELAMKHCNEIQEKFLMEAIKAQNIQIKSSR
jgi:hypothetical protein